MFDTNKFAQIIKSIKETYNSQEEFSEKSGIGRTYLSQYMNMKLIKPPTPRILEKLANASNGITNYNELMEVCGYIEGSKQLNDYRYEKLLYEMYDKFSSDEKKLSLSFKEEMIIHELLQPILPKLNKDFILTNDVLNFLLEDASYLDKETLKKIRQGLVLYIQYYIDSAKLSNKNEKNTQNTLKCISNSSLHMCPVYGQISAGQPNWAEECLEGYLPIDPNLMGIINPEQCFFLRVKGESMNLLIKNGAYALIRKQDIVENGEVAVVLVNGDEATLKKFTQHGDVIVLEPMSDNPNFKTQIYDKNTRIQILGKYIGKFEMK